MTKCTDTAAAWSLRRYSCLLLALTVHLPEELKLNNARYGKDGGQLTVILTCIS
jgi:hypothetical protein